MKSTFPEDWPPFFFLHSVSKGNKALQTSFRGGSLLIKSEKCVNRVSLYANNWEVDAAMESSQEEDAGRLVDSFSLEKLRSHHDIQI